MIMKLAIYDYLFPIFCPLFLSAVFSLFMSAFASMHPQQSYLAAVLVSSLVIASALVQESNDDDEPQGKDHAADASIYAPDWV